MTNTETLPPSPTILQPAARAGQEVDKMNGQLDVVAAEPSRRLDAHLLGPAIRRLLVAAARAGLSVEGAAARPLLGREVFDRVAREERRAPLGDPILLRRLHRLRLRRNLP